VTELSEVQQILERRKSIDAGMVGQTLARRKQEPSMLESAGSAIKEAFTGNERETESSQALPELAFSGILSGEDPAIVAKISPALLTTLDPQETIKILQANFPTIGVQQDEKGNFIVGNNRNGVKAIVNRPGFSGTDALQLGGLAAEFTPAAKAGSLTSGVLKKMGLVGAGVGLTETANQAAQASVGGEFNPEDVLIAGAGGAVFEGVFQGLARVFPVMRESVKTAGGKITDKVRETFKQEAVAAGKNADDVTDDVIRQTLFPEGAGLEGEKEFGIQLTKGQRSGSQKQLRLEDDLRAGRSTEKAQNTLLKQEAETQQQVRDAAGRIQQDLGAEGAVISSQQEAGSLITQGVRNAEQAANDAVRASFDDVGEAALQPEAFVKLFDATKNAIKGIDFPVTGETKATNALLKQINSARKFFNLGGIKLKPQHIQRIEQIRRSIGAQIKTAANPTDKRNMVTMQKGFDDFLDSAVKDALFTGDQEALNALKAFRSLFKEYARKFRANPKKTRSGATISDREGRFIELIIEGNPTDIQTVNAIFGAGNTFGNATAKNMANRFKTILGETSPEWGVVRQAAFKRLVRTGTDGKTISGQQTLKAVNQALEKNRELMDVLFSPEEIGLIRRFAAQIKRSQPDIVKGTANPSGSGTAVINAVKDNMGKLTQALGIASGNPVVFIAGKGFQTSSSFGAQRSAKAAIQPFEKIINPRPVPVAIGTTTTLEASQ